MSEGQPYTAQDEHGTLLARLKDGQVRLNSAKQEDGSVLLPIDESWPAIEKMLSRRSSSAAEIALAKHRFETSGNMASEVAPGIGIIKRSPTHVSVLLKSVDIDLALLKIAYEFLALQVGRSIFKDYFAAVRSALLNKTGIPTLCAIKPFRQKHAGYRPFHSILVRNSIDGLVVKILLFGYLSYHVRFSMLQLQTILTSRYTLDLRNGAEDI